MTKVTWKATLFDKAIGDIYIAKTCVAIRPDFAMYHCQQAVEKMIKGAMNCYNLDTFAYMSDHSILAPLKELLKHVELSEEMRELCKDFEEIPPSIRYSTMKFDPTIGMAKQYIVSAEKVMNAISILPKVTPYYNEAKKINDDIVKSVNAQST